MKGGGEESPESQIAEMDTCCDVQAQGTPRSNAREGLLEEGPSNVTLRVASEVRLCSSLHDSPDEAQRPGLRSREGMQGRRLCCRLNRTT